MIRELRDRLRLLPSILMGYAKIFSFFPRPTTCFPKLAQDLISHNWVTFASSLCRSKDPVAIGPITEDVLRHSVVGCLH